MRERRVLALDLFEEGDAFGDPVAVQEGERVVEFFARGVGCEVERSFEFGDGFDVRGGIFEEGFAEVAVTFDGRIFRGGDDAGREPEEKRG